MWHNLPANILPQCQEAMQETNYGVKGALFSSSATFFSLSTKQYNLVCVCELN